MAFGLFPGAHYMDSSSEHCQKCIMAKETFHDNRHHPNKATAIHFLNKSGIFSQHHEKLGQNQSMIYYKLAMITSGKKPSTEVDMENQMSAALPQKG